MGRIADMMAAELLKRKAREEQFHAKQEERKLAMEKADQDPNDPHYQFNHWKPSMGPVRVGDKYYMPATQLSEKHQFAAGFQPSDLNAALPYLKDQWIAVPPPAHVMQMDEMVVKPNKKVQKEIKKEKAAAPHRPLSMGELLQQQLGQIQPPAEDQLGVTDAFGRGRPPEPDLIPLAEPEARPKSFDI